MSRIHTNNIKISFEEPRYIIDEVNKVVICLLDYTADVPWVCDYAVYPSADFPNPLCMLTSKSVVRAKNNDTFDVTVGKKVALAKAENKAYSYVYEYYKRGIKPMTAALKALENFNNKVKKVKEHNIEYMKKF